jgi:hypothetical protein
MSFYQGKGTYFFICLKIFFFSEYEDSRLHMRRMTAQTIITENSPGQESSSGYERIRQFHNHSNISSFKNAQHLKLKQSRLELWLIT